MSEDQKFSPGGKDGGVSVAAAVNSVFTSLSLFLVGMVLALESPSNSYLDLSNVSCIETLNDDNLGL